MERITLAEYLYSKFYTSDEVQRHICEVIKNLARVGKIIYRHVRWAALEDMFGATGAINVQDEEVKKLDEYSNEKFVEVFSRNHLVKTVISEELGEPAHVDCGSPGDQFLLTLDPLDGSSNIDVDVTIGSIFGLFHRPDGFDSDQFRLPQ
ncbi:MAG TPA: hypothetical protein VLB27_10795, partial [candidate division Zixibacteria bacterium]|nr:hypothetical protein [candidate division Zixibacteria bacterium]